MIPKKRRLGPILALLLLAGCDSNPEGPRVPADALSKAQANGQTQRRPVTKNRREIVNPE